METLYRRGNQDYNHISSTKAWWRQVLPSHSQWEGEFSNADRLHLQVVVEDASAQTRAPGTREHQNKLNARCVGAIQNGRLEQEQDRLATASQGIGNVLPNDLNDQVHFEISVALN